MTRAEAARGRTGDRWAAGRADRSPCGRLDDEEQPTDPGSTQPVSGDGTISVQVSATGQTAGGGSYQVSAPPGAKVKLMCWYGQGKTGAAYYEYWKPGGEARKSRTLGDYADQGLLNPGWDTPEISTSTEGHWYDATCAFDAPADFKLQLLHDPPGHLRAAR